MSDESISPEQEPVQPKRRGRPPKERPAVEGEPAASQQPGEKPQPKRGRKPKHKTKSTSPEELETLAQSLYGIHAVMAQALSMPELMLDATASRTLAAGVSRMQEEFGFEVSGKTGAVLAFLGAAAMVYVPRVIAIKARVQTQKARQAQEKADGAIDADFAVSPGTNETPGVQ